jgi:hypothetical protein
MVSFLLIEGKLNLILLCLRRYKVILHLFFARNMPPVYVLQDGIIVHGHAMKRMREHAVPWRSQTDT